VTVALLSYQPGEPAAELERDGVHWSARGPGGYLARVAALARSTGPDWIIGLSDTWYGILAHRLASRNGTRCAIDAYDNYEGYIPWAWPLHWAWRRALARAALRTAAGPALLQRMTAPGGTGGAVVVPMAVDPIGFRRLDRAECRRRLGLPEAGRLLGYLGSLHPNRGPELLFEAVRRVRCNPGAPALELVLSGRRSPGLWVPSDARWLGYLPREQVPRLLNALDVLVVINRDSAFGRYSYPIKLYEAMACQVPAVATATPATRWILAGHPELLAPPADADALAERISAALARGRIDYGPQPTWEQGAAQFEAALLLRG
jgi:glycosyltransferase involved in cell wall biosynthesis